MSEPKPPARAPFYIWQEQHGWSARDCAMGLIDQLCGFVRCAEAGLVFKGDAAGRIWVVEAESERALLGFEADKAKGRIALSIGPGDWVRAEAMTEAGASLRAWVEDPYEEKQFWPNAADGDGEGPGRVSKRGAWLEIDVSRFPGAPISPRGRYFQLELDEDATFGAA